MLAVPPVKSMSITFRITIHKNFYFLDELTLTFINDNYDYIVFIFLKILLVQFNDAVEIIHG